MKMAINRKSRKRAKDQQELKASKEDYAIAKYIYQNTNRRIGDLAGQEVNCFYAEEAVNALLDSRWATGPDHIFTDRQSVVEYCHQLLLKEIFHRALLMKRTKPRKDKLKDAGDTGNDTPTESGTESRREKKKKISEEDKKEKSSKVKKLRLDPDEDKCPQYFMDGREIYVWIWEPVAWMTYIIGGLLIVGSILLCCYPLWPPELRTLVYYISLLGAAFLAVIIFLAILRYIIYYPILWATFGEHQFFLLPNLTEDCGFFESFRPTWEYKRKSDEKKTDDIKPEGPDKEEPAVDEHEDSPTSQQDTVEDTGGDKNECEEEFEMVNREEVSV